MYNKRVFLLNIFFSFLVIALSNLYYVFSNLIVSDGRVKIVLPVTMSFVILYVVIFGIISRKFLESKNYHYMTIFSIVLSVIFLLFAHKLELFYIVYHVVPAMPYITILGSGFLVYGACLYFLKSK